MIKAVKKSAATVLCFATCMTLFTGCGAKNVELTLKINDASFNFKNTVQDIYDAGFVICDTGYGEITSEEDLPEMEARTVDTISQYYIGIPTSDTMADYTGVSIQVYNPTSSDCSFKECSIFNYTYQIEPEESNDITVLFNDVDFSTTDPQGAVTAMETMGITFDEDDKAEFLDPATNDGWGWSLITNSASYRYGITSSKNQAETLYVNEIYFEKSLDIDY